MPILHTDSVSGDCAGAPLKPLRSTAETIAQQVPNAEVNSSEGREETPINVLPTIASSTNVRRNTEM